jgi:hypothetical protein
MNVVFYRIELENGEFMGSGEWGDMVQGIVLAPKVGFQSPAHFFSFGTTGFRLWQ